jgi:FixJ family two-component response regulator
VVRKGMPHAGYLRLNGYAPAACVVPKIQGFYMNIECGRELASGTAPDVFVVDKDASVRESLKALIQSAGWCAETFACAREFLSRTKVQVPSCFFIDDSLPDLSGLDVQARINADRIDLPIIFITNFPNVRTTVRAMKAGAVEFFTKPFNGNMILSAIRHAIDRSNLAMARQAQLLVLQKRYAILSSREREVMDLVVEGHINKQIGRELGISEVTVKAHRGKLMRKIQATTLADGALRVSFLNPQWTLPGCQRIQEDVQPQRQEFPIRVDGKHGDLGGSPLR